MIEIIILNLIYLTFPLTLYIIYCMYANVLNKKINDLIFTFFLSTGFYFLLRFGSQEISNLPIALISVPLLLAYINKSILSIGLLSLLTFIYYLDFGYGILILITLILTYGLYQILYIKYKNKQLFIFSFTIINVLPVVVRFDYFDWSKIIYLIEFIVLPYFIVFMIKNFEKVADLHTNLQNIEHEKQIRLSIFKITHEIKNPVAVCKGYLDMFDTSNIEHSEKYVPIIKSEISRTLCLLQDFLDLNRIRLEKEEMDLTVLLEDIKSSCIPLLKNNKITYKDNMFDDEIYLKGDYNRLKQVLINMIKNSVESLNEIEEPYIYIYYKLKKDYVHIFVEDNGCGMSREVLARVKEPFFTTKGTGTGLGVTISQEVIQGHGGIIRYSSKQGHGTKVEIILPLNN